MTDTPTLKLVAQELAQSATSEACMTGYVGKERLETWILDALTEAYERGQRDAMQWQPIETAPKDGTKVLIWDNGIELARWDECADLGQFEEGAAWAVWECEDSWYSYATTTATHWMTLPEPPNSEKEGGANGSGELP